LFKYQQTFIHHALIEPYLLTLHHLEMPSIRGITVHVTDHTGKDLAEWGVQRLRQSTGKGEKVSAYIQSTTGVNFNVSVQPRIPFVDHPKSESEVDEVDHIEDEEGYRGM